MAATHESHGGRRAGRRRRETLCYASGHELRSSVCALSGNLAGTFSATPEPGSADDIERTAVRRRHAFSKSVVPRANDSLKGTRCREKRAAALVAADQR